MGGVPDGAGGPGGRQRPADRKGGACLCGGPARGPGLGADLLFAFTKPSVVLCSSVTLRRGQGLGETLAGQGWPKWRQQSRKAPPIPRCVCAPPLPCPLLLRYQGLWIAQTGTARVH